MRKTASQIFRAFTRRIKYLSQYRNPFYWALSFYDALIRSIKCVKLPFWGHTIPIWLRGYNTPFYLRLGRSDWFVLEEVLLENIYNKCFTFHLNNIHAVIDLGANVGYTARLWKHRWPSAHIYAVEPNADNFRMCQMNLQYFNNIHLINACIVGHERPVTLKTIGIDSSIRMVEIHDLKQPLHVSNTYTIDHLTAEYKTPATIDLLKCDIEGTEVELFKRCRSWIQSIRNIIIEIHPPYSEYELMNDINNNGGRFVSVRLSPDGGQVFFMQRNDS